MTEHEVPDIHIQMERILRDPATLFSLLADGPNAETAVLRIADRFGCSVEMAEVVLDQQLVTLLR